MGSGHQNDDLAKLSELNENTILKELSIRFNANLIYVSIYVNTFTF